MRRLIITKLKMKLLTVVQCDTILGGFLQSFPFTSVFNALKSVLVVVLGHKNDNEAFDHDIKPM